MVYRIELVGGPCDGHIVTMTDLPRVHWQPDPTWQGAYDQYLPAHATPKNTVRYVLTSAYRAGVR